MLDSSLLEYLQKCKQSVLPFEIVSQELIKIGWQQDKIEEARQWYSGTSTSQVPEAALRAQSNTPLSQFESVTSSSQPSINKGNLSFSQSQNSDTTSEIKKTSFGLKSRVGTIVGLVVGGLLLLTSTTGVLAYMVAVEKIPVKNEFIKRSADTIVLTVPFIPKTPKIVLSRALMAHQQVSQSSLDFSIAATSDDFSSTI
ncbi:MAG: hypothetical protein ACOX6V_01880 [Patescibacteria group bacterium]|jgi:hypothetical protein